MTPEEFEQRLGFRVPENENDNDDFVNTTGLKASSLQ